MSSTTSKDWIIDSSLTNQENTNFGSPMKKGAGNLSRSADPCNEIQVVNSATKRRADDDGQMPSKRMRSSNPISPAEKAQVSVEDKGKASVDTGLAEKNGIITTGKRKASDEGEAPSKRARCGADEPETSPEATEASQEQILLSCINNLTRADFEEKYQELEAIGQGGLGSVNAGVRKADGLPVAIKHIPANNVTRKKVNPNSTTSVCLEVALMIATTGHSQSVGQHAEVTLLDWYDLKEELILVMERPEDAMDLLKYRATRGGHLEEHEAKIILKQLVDAAIHMESKGVFHRDIKLQNVLIHSGSNGPRARVIDFGCGTFSTKRSYKTFSGTLQYAPPEWFKKRKYKAHSTTVWQLGVLFYSLLGGHHRFTTNAFMTNNIEVNPALSPEVKILLDKCLAINPHKRLKLEELQRAFAMLVPSAPPTQGLQ